MKQGEGGRACLGTRRHRTSCLTEMPTQEVDEDKVFSLCDGASQGKGSQGLAAEGTVRSGRLGGGLQLYLQQQKPTAMQNSDWLAAE